MYFWWALVLWSFGGKANSATKALKHQITPNVSPK
jgi:hypothetical protein